MLLAAGLAVGAALGAAASTALRAHRQRAAAAPATTTTGPHRSTMPHPNWTPGEKQPPPYAATGSPTFIAVDPATTDKASMYALVISAVVPRPIALVSSVAADGSRNLAPYSYFNAMGHNPPVVAIGMCRSPGRGGGKKDSLINIEETGCAWFGRRGVWGGRGTVSTLKVRFLTTLLNDNNTKTKPNTASLSCASCRGGMWKRPTTRAATLRAASTSLVRRG
jgi:hypothetical protein